jgi:hypothetical protein
MSSKPSKALASKLRDLDWSMPTKSDLNREEASREPSPWETFDPDAPLTEFSFADWTKISDRELEEMISSLGGWTVKTDFILALRRGLGVHHAGMNRQYRQM